MTGIRKLKTHTKSRTGCAQCKARKRKCDESRPICERCKTAGLRCGFADLKVALPASPTVDQNGNLDHNHVSPSSMIDPTVRFSARDMGLLHHYTISTCHTLSRDRTFVKFYQNAAVRRGLSEPFLLHCILSLAALHLAQTLPEDNQENFTEAARHHDIALHLYQQALNDLNRDRYDAVFMAASLLFTFIFAYVVGNPSEASFLPGDAAELFLSFRWVRIARGIRVLRKEGQQWLMSSPVVWPVMGKTLMTWPIMRDPKTNQNVYDLDPLCPQEDDLARLKEMWEGDNKLEPGRAQIYEDAHHGLVRAYRRAHQRQQSLGRARHEQSGNEEFIQSLGWLADLSDGYIRLLEEHEPPALVLMGVYTKLLDNVSFLFWWTHSNSQICTSRIRRILPMAWHKWLE